MFRLSRGEYFKWLAYDDLCRSELIERCVEVLDRDPSLVMCTSRFTEIDAYVRRIGGHPYSLDLTSTRPTERFGRLMRFPTGQRVLYGVIRADALRTTGLHAHYHGSDRALLAELTLRGRIREIPEELWSSREHPARSPYVRATSAWQPETRRSFLTHVAILSNLLHIVLRAPLDRRERVRCLATLVGTAARRSAALALVGAGGTPPAARSTGRGPRWLTLTRFGSIGAPHRRQSGGRHRGA